MPPSVNPVHRDYETRAGVGRQSDAERFDEEITRLGREMVLAALTSELSAEYAPVVTHLVRARKALRAAFDKEQARSTSRPGVSGSRRRA